MKCSGLTSSQRQVSWELNFTFFIKNKGKLQAEQINLGKELVKEGKQ